MSLATRCTDCGTVFRVVEDQLRVSDGWVRCGRCSAVFNAQQHLVDLSAPAAPPNDPGHIELADEPRPEAAAQAHPPALPEALPQTFASPPMGRQLPLPPAMGAAAPDQQAGAWHGGPAEHASEVDFERTQSMVAATATSAGPSGHSDAPALQADPPMSTEGSPDVVLNIAGLGPAAQVAGREDPRLNSGDTAVGLGTLGSSTDMLAGAVAIDADEAMPVPSFMREPDRGAFWRRPAVRAALAVLATLLALALLLQAALTWRDALAAHWPALRPALKALCEPLQCTIGALRRIDQLSVESSALSRIEGAPLHRLAIALRNRADTAVQPPALELSLTDAQGKLLARRVLRGAELGLSDSAIAARAEVPLQALLSVGERRIAGYTVELFYP